MKTFKTMLVAGMSAGMLFAGLNTSAAQGLEPPEGEIRDCARQLCYNMRSCAGGEIDGVKPKDMVTKRSEQAQGRPEGNYCGMYALEEYMYCSDGEGQEGRVKDVKVPLKRTNVKATPTPSNN